MENILLNYRNLKIVCYVAYLIFWYILLSDNYGYLTPFSYYYILNALHYLITICQVSLGNYVAPNQRQAIAQTNDGHGLNTSTL